MIQNVGFYFKILEIVKLTLVGVEFRMFFQGSPGDGAHDFSFKGAKDMEDLNCQCGSSKWSWAAAAKRQVAWEV